MKTRYSLVVLFVIAGTLLAACGGAATPPPPHPPAAAPIATTCVGQTRTTPRANVLHKKWRLSDSSAGSYRCKVSDPPSSSTMASRKRGERAARGSLPR